MKTTSSRSLKSEMESTRKRKTCLSSSFIYVDKRQSFQIEFVFDTVRFDAPCFKIRKGANTITQRRFNL